MVVTEESNRRTAVQGVRGLGREKVVENKMVVEIFQPWDLLALSVASTCLRLSRAGLEQQDDGWRGSTARTFKRWLKRVQNSGEKAAHEVPIRGVEEARLKK